MDADRDEFWAELTRMLDPIPVELVRAHIRSILHLCDFTDDYNIIYRWMVERYGDDELKAVLPDPFEKEVADIIRNTMGNLGVKGSVLQQHQLNDVRRRL